MRGETPGRGEIEGRGGPAVGGIPSPENEGGREEDIESGDEPKSRAEKSYGTCIRRSEDEGGCEEDVDSDDEPRLRGEKVDGECEERTPVGLSPSPCCAVIAGIMNTS